MAEQADAMVSNTIDRKVVRVRFPLRARHPENVSAGKSAAGVESDDMRCSPWSQVGHNGPWRVSLMERAMALVHEALEAREDSDRYRRALASCFRIGAGRIAVPPPE